MPLAKIHVLESRYDEQRLSALSRSVQEALIAVLRIPPDDFFQIIYEVSRKRFLHTPSFVGIKYSDDFRRARSRRQINAGGPDERRYVA